MNLYTESKSLPQQFAATIQVRLATPQDSEDIFRWRNQPESRCWFNSTAEVTWDEHCQWYQRKLADSCCLMLIGEVDRQPFGVMRFDCEEEGVIASANLDAQRHGQGLGSQLMLVGTHMAINKLGCTSVIAHTKKLNKASQAALYKVGYSLHEESADELVFIYQAPVHDRHIECGA